LSGKRIDPDAALFRDAMSDVKPISQRARVPATGRKPPARALFTAADRAMVLVESLQGLDGDFSDTGDEISFRRQGVQDGVMRKLKRGEYRVEEVCDLHGLRVDEAKAALRQFLAEALARRLRCVRVIHGKGNGSPGREPVLKAKVRAWLVQKNEVIAFTQARAQDGGHGAVLVLLKPTSPPS
jgi:DNA-nicking Smr family endonuclease